MKMVKSLLLGSASGLVAVAGAQAADLPVKAKPVEYVKICSLYGAGYYYIPGTDICMKMGGYVRAEWTYGYGSTQTNNMWSGADGLLTRTDGGAAVGANATVPAGDAVWRIRAYVTQETRQQTAYGTLRTYLNVGISGDNSTTLSANRGFIQIAGFTVGRASSYFDHYSVAAVAYLVDSSSDTGDGGQEVFAYTAQLGNGVSASWSLEQPTNKRRSVGLVTGSAANPILGTVNNFAIGAGPANNYAKLQAPDFVANLRVDQAWGSAQVMGAIHQVNGGYYTPAGGAVATATGTASGHPSDEWGWAIGAGIKLNLPMIAQGDYVAAQVAYSEGAVRYVVNTAPNSPQAWAGNEIGYGLTSDGIMSNQLNSKIELTTMWGVAAAWEHFWTPALRTSLHGSYVETKYNTRANSLMCTAQNNASATAGSIQFTGGIGQTAAQSAALCNNNWSEWQIGSRTQWNVTKDFYMGFDVVYYRLNTASKGALVTAVASGANPTAIRTLDDIDAVAARVRWHRDIVP